MYVLHRQTDPETGEQCAEMGPCTSFFRTCQSVNPQGCGPGDGGIELRSENCYPRRGNVSQGGRRPIVKFWSHDVQHTGVLSGTNYRELTLPVSLAALA